VKVRVTLGHVVAAGVITSSVGGLVLAVESGATACVSATQQPAWIAPIPAAEPSIACRPAQGPTC
jgi:hypothetical protein